MAVNLIRQNERFLLQLSEDPSREVSRKISRYVDDQDWFPHLYPDLAQVESDQVDSGRFAQPPESEQYDTPPLADIPRHAPGQASDSEEMQQDDLDEILLHLSMDDSGKVSLVIHSFCSVPQDLIDGSCSPRYTHLALTLWTNVDVVPETTRADRQPTQHAACRCTRATSWIEIELFVTHTQEQEQRE
jgi:hypothetical protein